MLEGTTDYVERIADAHGVSGYAHSPSGTLVYAGYRDGGYELCTGDEQLTNVDGDLTSPEWLDGRGTILALRDEAGNEQYDVVEVDPDTGALSPVLDDMFLNHQPRQNPGSSDEIAVVSNRDRSLDLYTVDLDTGAITRRSRTDETVMGYAWGPEGDRLVYQAGLIEGSSLRVVDCSSGTDEILVDEPNSEQSLAYTDGGHGAWSSRGIAFTTNSETGYRELAVADGTGEYELLFENGHDKYDPRWTDDGDVVFVESRGGNRAVRVYDGDGVSTIEEGGLNSSLNPRNGAIYYTHQSAATAGDVYRDGEPVVEEGVTGAETVEPREVTYRSFDDRDVSARLYTPDEAPVGAVVQVHGGPPAQHFDTLDPLTQSLVEAGFEVLAPDYRGSIGYGRDFRKASDADLGGDDLEDVRYGARYLRQRGHDCVGVVGTSYGGYLTLMAVGATDAFDIGASVCGVVNWETTVENGRQYLGDYVVRKLGGTPDENPSLYVERSPITYVEDVVVPLFVVQGANDPRVPQSEAEQLVSSLRDREVPHEYLLFHDEGHGIVVTENRVEYVSRTVEFFEDQV